VETIAKGNAAEAAVLNEFVKRDFSVLVPFGGGSPFDLGVDLGMAILRVQCKSARRSKGCLIFNSCRTDHGRGRLPYAGLADVFGVYSPDTGLVYLVPVAGTPSFVVSLRVEPARNNQGSGVRHARDYEFDRWTKAELLALAVEGIWRAPFRDS
jgi:hypothetical protein